MAVSRRRRQWFQSISSSIRCCSGTPRSRPIRPMMSGRHRRALSKGGAISRKTGEYVATLTDVGKLYLLDNPTPPAPKLPRKPRLPKPAAEEPLSIESEVAKQLSTGVSPTTAPKRINRMKRPGFCSSVLLRRIWVCPRDIHRNLELVRCGLSRIDSRAILECRSVPC